MPVITKLQYEPRTKRTALYLDNQYCFNLNTEIVFKNHLKINQQINPQEIEHIFFESLIKSLHDSVMSKISIRPQSVKEAKIYLQKKIYTINQNLKKINIDPKIEINKSKSDNLINQIITNLIQNNYLNDETFAKYWIEKRILGKPTGKNLLNLELIQKGIETKIINKFLNDKETINENTNKEMIQTILRKAYKSILYKNYDKFKLKQILLRRLQSKGFSYSESKFQIDEILQRK